MSKKISDQAKKAVTVAEHWELIESGMHPEAPEIQRWETKKAFYAGAFSILKTVKLCGASPDISPKEAGFLMGVLWDECIAFRNEMIEKDFGGDEKKYNEIADAMLSDETRQ